MRHHAFALLSLLVSASSRADESAIVTVESSFRNSEGKYSTRTGMGTFVSADGILLTALHVVHNNRTAAVEIKLTPRDVLSSEIQHRVIDYSKFEWLWFSDDLDLVLIRFLPPAESPETKTPWLRIADTEGNSPTPGYMFAPLGPGIPHRLSAALSWTGSNHDFWMNCDHSGPQDGCRIRPYYSDFRILIADKTAKPGFSGGPILNTNGDIVGVVDLVSYAEPTIGIGVVQQLPDPLPSQAINPSASRGPHLAPGAIAVAAMLAEEPSLTARAMGVNSRCLPLQDLASTIGTLEAVSRRVSSNVVGAAAMPNPLAELKELSDLASRQSAQLANDKACGTGRAHAALIIKSLIRIYEIQLHLGSLRTLWSATRDALIRAPYGLSFVPSKKLCDFTEPAKWGSVFGVYFSPLERRLGCSFPGGFEGAAFFSVHDTSLCSIWPGIQGSNLTDWTPACDDPQTTAKWAAIVDAFPPEVTWMALADMPEEQGKLAASVIDSDLLSAQKVLAYASATPEDTIRQRASLVVDAAPLLAQTDRDLDTLVRKTLRQSTPAVLSDAAARAHAMNRLYEELPVRIRDACKADKAVRATQVLRSFTSPDVLTEALRSADTLPMEQTLYTLAVMATELEKALVETVFVLTRN